MTNEELMEIGLTAYGKELSKGERKGYRPYVNAVIAAILPEIAGLRAENEKLREENEKLQRRSKMWFKVAQDLGHQDTFLPDMGDSDD